MEIHIFSTGVYEPSVLFCTEEIDVKDLNVRTGCFTMALVGQTKTTAVGRRVWSGQETNARGTIEFLKNKKERKAKAKYS